jgi:hypothetical protein
MGTTTETDFDLATGSPAQIFPMAHLQVST